MDVSSKISAAMSHLAAVASTSSPVQPSGNAQPPEPEPSAGASGVGVSAQLSRPAQLISKLSQLRDSAPEQFKQVVSSLATQLRNVSEQDSGMGAKMLVDLANKLDKAASDAQGPASGVASPVAGPSPNGAASDAGAIADGASSGGPNGGDTNGGAPGDASPRKAAHRAAVDAYRATAAAHPGGERAAARAIESVDGASAGAAAQPRRR